VNAEDQKYLLYGETTFDGLYSMLDEPAIKEDLEKSKIFYDLGSGTGKVSVGASLLLSNLEKILGIELVPTLHETANQVTQKLPQTEPSLASKLEFMNKNFFDVDFSYPFPADVIFKTCLIDNAEHLDLKLEEKMKKELKPGTIIVSYIKSMQDIITFLPLISKRVPSSFGGMTVHYYRKVS